MKMKAKGFNIENWVALIFRIEGRYSGTEKRTRMGIEQEKFDNRRGKGEIYGP